MQDIIDKALQTYYKKGKEVDVLRRYLKLKYKTNIDTASIRTRLHTIEERERKGYLLNS